MGHVVAKHSLTHLGGKVGRRSSMSNISDSLESFVESTRDDKILNHDERDSIAKLGVLGLPEVNVGRLADRETNVVALSEKLESYCTTDETCSARDEGDGGRGSGAGHGCEGFS